MNERIRKMVAAYGDVDLQWNDFEVAKFAEVIIKECIDILDKSDPGFNAVSRRIVKQHFGVK